MSAVMHCYSPDAPQTERLAAYLEEKEARVERRKAFSRRHAGETVVQAQYSRPNQGFRAAAAAAGKRHV